MESTQAGERATSSQSAANGPGPGSAPVGRALIGLIVLVVLLSAVADLYALMKVWPHPTPSGGPIAANAGVTAGRGDSASKSGAPPATGGKGDTTRSKGDAATRADSTTKVDTNTRKLNVSKNALNTGVRGFPGALRCDTSVVPRSYALSPTDSMYDPECVSIAGREFPLWAEQRLLLIVILCGFLGGLVHTIRSIGWYIGNRWLVRSWIPFYALLPLTGAMIAVAFYLVIRGGFFSPSGSFRDTSPFGFAAMSVLVGMFSTPAALKLQQLAETMLTKPGSGADAKPQTTSEPGPAKPTGTAPAGAEAKSPTNVSGHLPRGSGASSGTQG